MKIRVVDNNKPNAPEPDEPTGGQPESSPESTEREKDKGPVNPESIQAARESRLSLDSAATPVEMHPASEPDIAVSEEVFEDSAPQPDLDVPSGAPAPAEEIDWKDRYIRLAADFDNFRKRTAREEQAVRRRVKADVLRSWLEIIDTTERAINSSTDRESPWYEGIQALYRQMLNILKGHGVQRIETEGQMFDPYQHEAIAAIPVQGFPKGTIVQTDRAGFLLEDGEVLRPARVLVAQ